jgi:hypothetical protein
VWVVVRALVGDPSRGDTAYLKDALMVIAMAVLIVAVPADYVGGIGNPFDRIMQMRPDLIAVQSGTAFDQTGWLTGVLISAIGRGFMTPAPSSLSAVARGRRPEVLRRNDVWLPIYQLVIILPVIIGFVGVLALPKGDPEQRHPADARRRRVTCLADRRHRRRDDPARPGHHPPRPDGEPALAHLQRARSPLRRSSAPRRRRPRQTQRRQLLHPRPTASGAH